MKEYSIEQKQKKIIIKSENINYKLVASDFKLFIIEHKIFLVINLNASKYSSNDIKANLQFLKNDLELSNKITKLILDLPILNFVNTLEKYNIKTTNLADEIIKQVSNIHLSLIIDKKTYFLNTFAKKIFPMEKKEIIKFIFE